MEPTTFRGPKAEPGIGALTLGRFLADAVARYAECEAIVFADAGGGLRRWTYADLWRESRRVGSALIAAGVGRGDRVALLMGNRPEWVASLFGVALAGGVLVPVNTYLAAPELAYVLDQVTPRALLAQRRLDARDYAREIADARAARLVWLDDGRGDGWEEFVADGSRAPAGELDARAAAVGPDDRAVIVYTSGTTAMPKGVLHAHRAPARQAWRFARLYRLPPHVRAWTPRGLFWTASIPLVLGATFAVGGCVVLHEGFEPGEALRLIERERVQVPHAWPHEFAALEEHPEWSRRDFSSVRYVSDANPFARHPTVRAPGGGWSPHASYGLTEAFTIVTALPADAPRRLREGSNGRVLSGNAVRILDAGTRDPLPAGCEGEIAVAGSTLMLGYWEAGERRDAADEDGFVATGDIGWVDERGLLHWTGRRKDVIRSGGVNVSPLEVEAALAAHPGVRAAVVVGYPHARLGEVPVACVVAKSAAAPDEAALRGYLAARIAPYKVPRRVVFLSEEELPLTGSRKIRADAARTLVRERLAGDLDRAS